MSAHFVPPSRPLTNSAICKSVQAVLFVPQARSAPCVKRWRHKYQCSFEFLSIVDRFDVDDCIFIGSINQNCVFIPFGGYSRACGLRTNSFMEGVSRSRWRKNTKLQKWPRLNRNNEVFCTFLSTSCMQLKLVKITERDIYELSDGTIIMMFDF